jgi:hypothetical protein
MIVLKRRRSGGARRAPGGGVLGAWCLVLGAWCLVLGAWCDLSICMAGARRAPPVLQGMDLIAPPKEKLHSPGVLSRTMELSAWPYRPSWLYLNMKTVVAGGGMNHFAYRVVLAVMAAVVAPTA